MKTPARGTAATALCSGQSRGGTGRSPVFDTRSDERCPLQRDQGVQSLRMRLGSVGTREQMS